VLFKQNKNSDRESAGERIRTPTGTGTINGGSDSGRQKKTSTFLCELFIKRNVYVKGWEVIRGTYIFCYDYILHMFRLYDALNNSAKGFTMVTPNFYTVV
jgi:hypothetical protein